VDVLVYVDLAVVPGFEPWVLVEVALGAVEVGLVAVVR